MQPEEIRKKVETIVAGLTAGNIGPNVVTAKRDAEKAMLDLVTMFIVDVHKIAESMSDQVVEIIPGDYPA
jgi:hypothetical protein